MKSSLVYVCFFLRFLLEDADLWHRGEDVHHRRPGDRVWCICICDIWLDLLDLGHIVKSRPLACFFICAYSVMLDPMTLSRKETDKGVRIRLRLDLRHRKDVRVDTAVIQEDIFALYDADAFENAVVLLGAL